jgi:hypothetical protein
VPFSHALEERKRLTEVNIKANCTRVPEVPPLTGMVTAPAVTPATPAATTGPGSTPAAAAPQPASQAPPAPAAPNPAP